MSVIINDDDMPKKIDILQGVTRLRKCAEILRAYRSNKHKDEDPLALQQVANFLEMLSKKDWKEK